jgi:hypothetical protein
MKVTGGNEEVIRGTLCPFKESAVLARFVKSVGKVAQGQIELKSLLERGKVHDGDGLYFGEHSSSFLS